MFINAGKIISTEDTYKYHMQVQEAPPEPSLKLGDVPKKANLKPARGRNSSVQRSPSQISDVASRHQDGEATSPGDPEPPPGAVTPATADAPVSFGDSLGSPVIISDDAIK